MTGRLGICLLAGLALTIFAQVPQVVSQTSLGTVSTPVTQSCGNRNFDPPNMTLNTPGMTCYAATLQGCTGNDDLPFVYGVEVLPNTTPNGTIVFFSGGGGDHAADGPDQISLIESYVVNGYQVVQIAWEAGTTSQSGQDWEDTNTGGGSNAASILNAACRPATFLNWIRNSNTGVGNGLWGGHGGMCAHGHSAGSAALAYALAWHNAGAATATNGQGYLDKAVFTAGPVFSDIDKGCEVPNNQQTLMCVATGQVGCSGWPPVPPPPIAMSLV